MITTRLPPRRKRTSRQRAESGTCASERESPLCCAVQLSWHCLPAFAELAVRFGESSLRRLESGLRRPAAAARLAGAKTSAGRATRLALRSPSRQIQVSRMRIERADCYCCRRVLSFLQRLANFAATAAKGDAQRIGQGKQNQAPPPAQQAEEEATPFRVAWQTRATGAGKQRLGQHLKRLVVVLTGSRRRRKLADLDGRQF